MLTAAALFTGCTSDDKPTPTAALAYGAAVAINRWDNALAAQRGVRVATNQSHRGWRDAVILRNGVVEAVVVPSVGRVMQFRLAGRADGPFWENEKLAGHTNFCWPCTFR